MLSFSFETLLSTKILMFLFGLGCTLILTHFFCSATFPDSRYNFLGETKRVKLDPDKAITQSFVADQNNLKQIKVIIGNTDLWPFEKIVFELKDASCEVTLRKDTHSFFSLQPHIYTRFTFDAIQDSKDRTYCVSFTYTSPHSRGDERPYLAATEDENTFAETSYANKANDRVYENRSLQMRPGYDTGSILQDEKRFIQRISQYKPFFLKDAYLEIILTFYIGGSILLARFILKQ